MGGVEIPETQKNISQEHLPYVWITQLNSCFNNMHKYNTLPENWDDTYRNIVDARNAVLEYFKILLDSIEKFYRNENVCVFKTGNYEEKKVKAIRLTGTNPYTEPKCAVDKYGIRVNNYVVEDRQDKYSNERRIESDKQHISNLCHEYFSHIHAFCENGEKILIDAKRGKQREQKSRIAYYSLIQALSELNVFQQRFDDYFRNIGIFPKSNLEVELIEKMAALFTIIFFNNFAREKSICYKAKENVRVTERKITEFMKNGIKTLPGVKYASDKEKAMEVEVDIFKYEDFLSQLYHTVKKLAKEMDNLSLPGYLLQKHFSNLSVNLT